ncbi:hypothetical protein LPTSP3_g37190 [Leptospira kobayashii]|uniref:Uncharacterized protein n=1 Tax=Leptospira kobayashii TaxID=1917830 RepID=A0ABN6KLI7_9LEPT|nr:hypothetical protein [Leptospira kobayashii]BDA80789.1 hypothetical protein LPTSP3_g37190 [Leptospira kobayashii]
MERKKVKRWEELANDRSLEKRVTTQVTNRFKKEKRQIRTAVGTVSILFLLTNALIFNEHLPVSNDLPHHVSMLVDEWDTGYLAYLGQEE